ncbi:MAG: hypothetical protein KDJ37_08785 [Hyphomicrobiaceae bacterium]|nr:hypothetical protein [Hyphomicrobiaceae bacterium]
MSFLSLSLTSFANSLDAYSEDGAVLKPDAVQSIVTFLLEAARDAQKLERMLERRLKAGELPRAASPLTTVDVPPASNVLTFPTCRPSTAASGGDAA